jgi:hypothetical protein
LQSRGWLKPSLDPEHLTRERRIAGKKHRVFVFNQFWINEKAPETPETPETDLEIGSNVELQPSPAVSDSKIDTRDTGDNISSENNNEIDTLRPVSGVSGRKNPPETDRRQAKCNDSKASSLVSSVSPVSPVENRVSENASEQEREFKVGDRVKPADPFHERGQDVGIVKSIEGEQYVVQWQSDSNVRRYTRDELVVAT